MNKEEQRRQESRSAKERNARVQAAVIALVFAAAAGWAALLLAK